MGCKGGAVIQWAGRVCDRGVNVGYRWGDYNSGDWWWVVGGYSMMGRVCDEENIWPMKGIKYCFYLDLLITKNTSKPTEQ